MNNEKEAFLEGERQWLDPDNDYHLDDDEDEEQEEYGPTEDWDA